MWDWRTTEPAYGPSERFPALLRGDRLAARVPRLDMSARGQLHYIGAIAAAMPQEERRDEEEQARDAGDVLGPDQ
jgi:hypothetical protein